MKLYLLTRNYRKSDTGFCQVDTTLIGKYRNRHYDYVVILLVFGALRCSKPTQNQLEAPVSSTAVDAQFMFAGRRGHWI